MSTPRHLAAVDTARDVSARSVAHVLYQVSELLPDQQTVLSVPPTTTASDALKLMKEHGYSQVPVIQNNIVVGVFSHRSFANGVLDLAGESKLRAEQLPVLDFVEQLAFADLAAEITDILPRLDRDNAILVGTSRRLLGLATPMNALHYFYRVANGFLLLQEIERAIRLLLGSVLGPADLAEALARCSTKYSADPKAAPSAFEELSFGDYVNLVGNKTNWSRLESVFGTSRELVLAKLKPVNQLRNDAFHFKRELTDDDFARLSGVRSWLRIRLVLAEVEEKL
jgi:hypothetical protein